MDALSPAVGRAFFGDFKELRPVQQQAIPAVLAGNDTLIRSATASGKTEAAIAPLVERYLQPLVHADGVTLLIVSPTRALVNDLHRRLEQPLHSLGVSVGVRHGERNQLQSAQPPAVLITTPESFDIEVGRESDALATVKSIVLDESHLLYNTQRGMQVAITIERLESWTQRKTQVIGLSATIGRAEDVWAFFRPGRTVHSIDIPGGRSMDLQLRIGVDRRELVQHLHKFDDKKVLVFVNSRRECDSIVDELHSTPPRCDVYAHHSSLPRETRDDTEQRFESAASAICIATSTLELGIDIGAIDVVAVWGSPANWQSLAQRLGRGNRRTGHVTGLLYALPGEHEHDPGAVFAFQALLNQMHEPNVTDERPREIFGAAAQQLASKLVADGRFRGINRLTGPLSKWPHLDPQTVTTILDELVSHDTLVAHPAYRQYGPGEGAYELERTWDLWSNFGGRGREAEVHSGRSVVGRISVRDVHRLKIGDALLLGGRRWRVVRASDFDVEVRSTDRSPNVELHYGSGASTVDPMFAEAVRRVLLQPVEAMCSVRPKRARERLENLRTELAYLADDSVLPESTHEGGTSYLTFAGRRLNAMLAEWHGEPNATVTEFTLTTRQPIIWGRIPASVAELNATPDTTKHVTQTTFQRQLPDDLQDQERKSADLAPYGYEAILARLATALPLPVDDQMIELASGTGSIDRESNGGRR